MIYGYLLVKDAVNPAAWIGVSFFIFTCIYIILGTTLLVLLLRLARTAKSKLEWSEFVQAERPGENVQKVGVK